MADNNFNTNRRRSGSSSSESEDDKGFISERPAGFPWKLLVFSLVLLLFSVFVFFGLRFGYGPYLESQQQEVDEELDALSSRLGPTEQDDFLTFYSQMTNLQEILNSRLRAGNLLTFLEDSTLPLVYFENANYDEEETVVTLSGAASSLRTVVEQLSILEGNSNVDNVSVGTISITEENEARFQLELSLSEEYLQ